MRKLTYLQSSVEVLEDSKLIVFYEAMFIYSVCALNY